MRGGEPRPYDGKIVVTILKILFVTVVLQIFLYNMRGLCENKSSKLLHLKN
jgi:hypothetical protein